ncbi:MAG: U32 family peptidase, partial [Paludibacteraceae bacterium]|nr:U32 family peptidase [Paludibacteraceae bacterium]
MLTLLAPAKNVETAQAAIQAGADVVYIGASAFGARQAAGNSLEDIARLVQYARPYGVQVLVTLNTLLRPDEVQPAVRMAWQLYEAGVDALIIQDMQLLRHRLPPIRLHASTQCDNRTKEQVVRLQRLGFHRAVLARELSVEEIRAIRQVTLQDNPNHPIELEAFVHGALCVCYSGRCYMSEQLMNRSANRGECAQMCRMAYDLLDRQGNELQDESGHPIHQQYLLSLKDLDRSAYLNELIDAGITTFKIEGRLKNSDYVTNVVAYYRQKLDAIIRDRAADPLYEPSSAVSQYAYSFTPDPERTFHRSQTDYFLHGRTPAMASWQSPKSTGQPIGTFLRTDGKWLILRLLPDVELHTGDGIGFGNDGF